MAEGVSKETWNSWVSLFGGCPFETPEMCPWVEPPPTGKLTCSSCPFQSPFQGPTRSKSQSLPLLVALLPAPSPESAVLVASASPKVHQVSADEKPMTPKSRLQWLTSDRVDGPRNANILYLPLEWSKPKKWLEFEIKLRKCGFIFSAESSTHFVTPFDMP